MPNRRSYLRHDCSSFLDVLAWNRSFAPANDQSQTEAVVSDCQTLLSDTPVSFFTPCLIVTR